MEEVFLLGRFVELRILLPSRSFLLKDLNHRETGLLVGLLVSVRVLKRHFACCRDQISKRRIESFAVTSHS